MRQATAEEHKIKRVVVLIGIRDLPGDVLDGSKCGGKRCVESTDQGKSDGKKGCTSIRQCNIMSGCPEHGK